MKLTGHICLLTVLLSMAVLAEGQQIVGFNVPSSMCAGSSQEVSFGFIDTHNVVLYLPQATLGHSDRIFLPDGVQCGTLGCSYRSPVTFTDFAPGATITSVQDIEYVRLNMEHSYIGDIYIGITCPNGQKASLMNFAGTGTSSCSSTIPAAHRGWSQSLVNVSENTYFGQAYDYGNATYKCDSTASGNEPGIGWNYCWSDNTTSGYSYAHASALDDGIIYRNGHAHYSSDASTKSIDSSNVAAGTNFYHPNQSFSNLIGCPLNGEWYIEVIDGFSQDNGYIFEWELALDADLIPHDTCIIDSFSVVGYGIVRIDDSTFTIQAPEHITADTVVEYTYRIYTSCGDTIDTTAFLTFHPDYLFEADTAVCEHFVWKGITYSTNANLTSNFLSIHGCDSVERVHINIRPGYHLQRSDTIVENDLPYTFLGRTFGEAVSDTLLTGTTLLGCDSNVLYSLAVIPNCRTDVYDTVCSDMLPYLWNGLAVGDTSHLSPSTSHLSPFTLTDSVVFLTWQGADSVVALHLEVLPTTDSTLHLEVVENNLPATFDGLLFYADADTLYHRTNHLGCDSTVHLTLTVHPNRSFTHSATICDNQLPYEWLGHTFDDADTVTLHLTDIYGADSNVTLMLSIYPSFHIAVDTTLCDNIPFVLGDLVITEPGVQTLALTSADGCDSIIDLNLVFLPHDELLVADTVCVNTPYPFDDSVYYHSGLYTHTFVNSYGCDSILTLRLHVMAEGLKAIVRATPEIVTPADLDFRLNDHSIYSHRRQWFLADGTTSTERVFYHTFPADADSLPVILVAYSPEGCPDTADVVVRIDRANLAIPNTFTPGESTNSTWQPAIRDIKELEVWIYNRQGLLVAHLEGLDAYWDGTHNGTPCPQGAYVYNLRYSTNHRPNKQQQETGTILLIR